MGSKTPIDSSELDFVRLCAAADEVFSFCADRICRSVFNGLRAPTGCRRERFGGAVHYVGDGHVVRTRGARFGPNFVTIQPLGVCVCSF
jgi:hypothetical protein